jgi:hypothetical protein
MAVNNKLLRGFANFQGLDLRSSDLDRSPEFATEILNVDYRKTGAMTKRKGYQGKLTDRGGYGTSIYADLNITTGAITEKMVTVDDTLWIQSDENLTITYTGSETARCDMYYSPSESAFYLDLYDDNVLVLHTSLGVVVEELSFVTVSDLVTAINAVTDFSASGSGNTGSPAAFLGIKRDFEITAAGNDISYTAWEEAVIPTNAPTPFTAAQAAISNQDFENASFANINGVLYIATGYDAMYKFDGVRLYKAGLPEPVSAPTTALVAGSVTDTRKYQYTYEYTDAKGNIIESEASDESITVSPAGQDVTVTVNNIQETTGFDTDSTNLKINLYATTASGSTFYLIKTVTNIGTTATQDITDDVADPSLFPEFITPIKAHGLPPIGKYLAVHQGILLVGGLKGDVNSVAYSDIDSPEFFPAGDNSFSVETSVGDKVSGIAPLGNSFFVFKDNTVHQVTGAINEDNFRVDLYGNGSIGCAAFHTIREVNGFLFFLSKKGVYALSQNSNEFTEISELIENRFTTWNQPFTFKKATAINWLDEDKYVVHMPNIITDYSTSESAVFVYDYFRQAWLEWDGINATGGFAIKDSNLFFTERRFSVQSSSTTSISYVFLNSGDSFDYADHTEAINLVYKSHWEAMNEPSLFKKFLRCKIHSLDGTLNDFESSEFTLDLSTEIDYIDVASSQVTLDFSGGVSGGWGASPWGTAPWGATRLASKVTKLRAVKARSLRLVLENDNIHENVLVSGYEFEVATPYKAFIKE